VLDAARHLIVTFGYVTVVSLTAMFAFHVAGWTLCRCLHLRLVLPTCSAPVRSAGAMSTDSSVQTFIRHAPVDVDHDVSDDDVSDYDSSHLDSRVAAAHAHRYDSSPLTSSVAAAACSLGVVEFKYSETNV